MAVNEANMVRGQLLNAAASHVVHLQGWVIASTEGKAKMLMELAKAYVEEAKRAGFLTW